MSTTSRRIGSGTTEPIWAQRLLTAVALGFVALFLVLPLVTVLTQALASGWDAYV